MAHVSLITLAVRDLAASGAFYEAMGWERSGSSNDEIVFLRGGTVALALYPAEAFAEEVGITIDDPADAVALATNVASPDVVDTFLAAAQRAGGAVAVPAARMHWGGYSGYFTDPDGHLWEVAHNPFMPLGDDGRIELDPDPDELSPAQVTEHLAAFRAQVDADPGDRTVEELADEAAAVLAAAAAEVADRLEGVPTNTIIAAMSELTNRAMAAEPGSPEQGALSAASSLVAARLG